jgi:hypothetical protein
MSLAEMPTAVRFDPRPGRSVALAALVGVWLLEVTAVYLGRADHAIALHVGTIFLLWRVWRGGRWSLALLRVVAVVGAGLAVAMTIAAWVGVAGLVIPTLWAALLLAGTGLLLFGPPIQSRRRGARRS